MSYPFGSGEQLVVVPGNGAIDRTNEKPLFDRTTQKIESDRTSDNGEIRPTIEAYGQIEISFDYLNTEAFLVEFGTRLPHVVFTLPRSRRFAGYFDRDVWTKERTTATRASEIALNPHLFCNPAEVLQTLAHEMVHLGQAALPEIFGKPGQRGYHNAAFAVAMERIGLMPSNVDDPTSKTGYRMTDYVIAGGLFESVCKRYLELGGQISWSTRAPSGAPGTGGVGGTTGTTQTDAERRKEAERDRKKRSKTRFTCPGCKLNAWAKPDAKLECGHCKLAMNADACGTQCGSGTTIVNIGGRNE